MAKRAKKQLDELDTFAQAGPEKALMLVLWKVRHHYPEMAVPITADDLHEFQKSVEFTKQKPSVVVYRRPAQEARAGIPAQGKRKAIPSAPAQPAGRTAVVMVVEENTAMVDAGGVMLSPGNTIRPVESDPKAHDIATKQRQVKAAREKAVQIANELTRDASVGMYSDSKISEAAQALVMLANA